MKCEKRLTDQQRTLVEENLPLVRQTISRHIRCNESICGLACDDLFQEGFWALCHAAMTYDGGERGVPFSAYARPVIRNHLLDHCRRVLLQREHLPTVLCFGAAHSQGHHRDAGEQERENRRGIENRIVSERAVARTI